MQILTWFSHRAPINPSTQDQSDRRPVHSEQLPYYCGLFCIGLRIKTRLTCRSDLVLRRHTKVTYLRAFAMAYLLPSLSSYMPVRHGLN